MAIFPTLFFGNIGKENFFYDNIERKNAFLGYKNKTLEKSKKKKQKEKTLGFGPKMAIFPTFFLASIGQKNIFNHIPERKNAFVLSQFVIIIALCNTCRNL